MTELIVIRHGQTDWNLEPRFQGQVDVPLNAVGRDQARRLADLLAAERPAVLLSSDLKRTRETAAPLARAWGLDAECDPAWREQAFGLFDGHDFGTLQREHPALWARWIEFRADFALPGGGESTQAFDARVAAALAALAERHPQRKVVLVTHGGVLDMLWRRARAESLDGPRRVDTPNTGINRLRLSGAEIQIEAWAQTPHLAAA
jgi:probable phosphoglycerate mutase